MRLIPLRSTSGLEDRAMGTCDWRSAPSEGLELIDGLLADHGLEIVQYDGGDDGYRFKVETRRAAGGMAA